jgi:hypothetical protein
MSWLAWSNPVAIWWSFLIAISAVNIAIWLALHNRFRSKAGDQRIFFLYRVEVLLLLLCAGYVFGCAFRSALPRADVQRICLFDTWLSSVVVGRSVATIAEMCFAAQWAIVLHQLAKLTKADTARNIASAILPLIVLAECCSWYAVVTTSYLGNAVENSLWTVTYLLIAVALARLLVEFHGVIRLAIACAILGIAGYLGFMLSVDLPMYFGRWHADVGAGKEPLGILAGFYDVSTRWTVTREIVDWKDEIAWMSLYFSVAVWSSLALCGFALVKDRLPQYCTRLDMSGTANRRLRFGSRAGRAGSGSVLTLPN